MLVPADGHRDHAPQGVKNETNSASNKETLTESRKEWIPVWDGALKEKTEELSSCSSC